MTNQLSEDEKDMQPQHMRGVQCFYCDAPAKLYVTLIATTHMDGGYMRLSPSLRLGEPVCAVHAEPSKWQQDEDYDTRTVMRDAARALNHVNSVNVRLRAALERIVEEGSCACAVQIAEQTLAVYEQAQQEMAAPVVRHGR